MTFGRRSVVRAALAVGVVLLWWLNDTTGPYAVFWGSYNFRTLALNLGITWLSLCGSYVALGGDERRLRWTRVLLLNAVCVACVAAGEVPTVLFGHDYRDTFHTWREESWLARATALNKPDEELLHIHWPHTSWEGSVRGNLAALGISDPPWHGVSVSYDRNGFRNDTDLEGVDVAVIGDSFVEGAIVRAGDTFSRQLAVLVGASTVNLGQAAYGPQQELLVLERFARPLAPRVVIWCVFGGNDLLDVTLYEQARDSAARVHLPGTVSQRSLTRNALLRLSIHTTPDPGPSATARAQRGTLRDEHVWFGRNTAPWSDHQWQVLTDTLREAHSQCAPTVRFVVAYVPRKFTVYGDLVTDKGTALQAWTRTTLPAELGAWCQEADIRFCDLTPALRKATLDGVQTYHPDDTHWNAEGHRIAAEAVAEFIGR